MENSYQLFFALLRAAMTGEQFEAAPTDEAWADIFNIAKQQSVVGVCYSAMSRLPNEQLPPMKQMVKWVNAAEVIRKMNELLNNEAALLTQLFAEQGRQTAILKGQANARLYPDTLSRQVGDIDIWVDGGKESVIALLKNATEDDRRAVAEMIKPLGLRHSAEALMWVLGEMLHLEKEKMYCKKDSYRGEWMLREMMEGGNFGRSAKRKKTNNDILYSLRKHKHIWQLVPFAPAEVLFLELKCMKDIIIRIPERIKYRKLSLRQ